MSLPSGASPWNGTSGRVEGQNTTLYTHDDIIYIDERRTTTLFYKNITLTLYSQKGLKLPWGKRLTETGTDKDRLLYWPITSLDHSTLCYLQDIFELLPHLCRGFSSGGCGGPLASAGALTDCKLALTLVFTANWLNSCGHLHVLFHNAHLLSIRSQGLLSFFSRVHLWLTARSRVNMKHCNSFIFLVPSVE